MRNINNSQVLAIVMQKLYKLFYVRYIFGVGAINMKNKEEKTNLKTYYYFHTDTG